MNLKKILMIFFMLFGLNNLNAGAVDDEFWTVSKVNLNANVLLNDIGFNKRVTYYYNLSCGKINSFYSNGTFNYDPQDCSGDVTFKYDILYNRYRRDTATVTIHIDKPVVNFEPKFNKRKYFNIIGNIKVIGNTVLVPKNGDTNSNLTNDNINLQYVDIDDNSDTFNSSSATIGDKIDGVDVNKSKIIWARLYWTGHLHNDNKDEGIDTKFNYSTPFEMIDAIANQKILFKVNNQDYQTITPNPKDIYINYYYKSTTYNSFYYAASADVTSILKNLPPNQKFTVANIPTRSGKTMTGDYRDGTGNIGAWTLVVVYDNMANINEKARNITVFDGFEILDARRSPEVTIDFDGFKTPKNAPDGVDSKLYFFTAEGDKNIHGDKAYLINQDNEVYQLPGVSDSSNYFDSSVTDVSTRDKLLINNNGIDIHTENIGTKYGDDKPIKINQTSAKLKMTTTGDYYMPIMAAFSTELYTPKLCYDYDIKLGDYYSVPSDGNRSFTVQEYGDSQLQVTLLIKNEDSDFDLIHSKAYLKFTPDGIFDFNTSRYTPPNIYAYEDSYIIDQDKGIVAVGRDQDDTGGIISSSDKMYYKFYYKFKDKNYFKGKFDLYVDANISFDGANQINYLLSTDADPKSARYIRRCDTNPTYDPVYGIFNVERGDSTFEQSEAERYSLKTQVVGVPYQISVATYKQDSNGRYTIPSNDMHTDVEVELINAGSMENNSSSGFDSICQNPESYSRGVMVPFNGNSRKTINIPEDYPTYPSNLALRNAVFRVWALTKEKNGVKEIVKYHCRGTHEIVKDVLNIPYVRNACYKVLYGAVYAPYEAKTLNPKCAKACATDIDPNGNGCYDCLRKYYAKPFCSRDNFAIRPYSYDVTLFDNNQTTMSNPIEIGSNSTPKVNDIAAGYKYLVKTRAIDTNGSTVKGYNFIDANSSSYKSSEAKFDISSGANCNDTKNKNVNVVIFNGESTKQYYDENNNSKYDNTLLLDNVGKYKFAIIDKEWTLVDQPNYQYKPFPNIADCQLNSTDAQEGSKVGVLRGCDIKSNIDPKVDLTIVSHPYRFNISSIDAISRSGSNYVYINDINSTKSAFVDNSIMALNIRGDIKALGKDGKVLSNYKKGCMAQDLNLSFAYTQDLNKSFYLRPLNAKFALYDSNVITNYQDTNVSIVNNSELSNKFINTKLKKEYFYPSFGGVGKLSLYINYNRRFNDPINPFKFSSRILDINSTKEKMTVDLNSNHYPVGVKDLNKTHIFYYAKTKPLSEFYDDIYADFVNTPVSIALYCGFVDKSKCANYDINITGDNTDEYDWWYSRKHNSNAGKVLITLTQPTNNSEINLLNSSSKNEDLPKFAIKPNGTIENWDNGIAKDINITKIVNPDDITYPYIVNVYIRNEMKIRYPYLLFNNKGNNLAPSLLWRNRFVKVEEAWSGQGKSGYSVDTNTTGRRNKKIDW